MPISTGNPATVAYAMALGITTAAVVSPARTSGRNQSARYCDSQSRRGRRKLTLAGFAGDAAREMGPRGIAGGHAANRSPSASRYLAGRLAGPAAEGV